MRTVTIEKKDKQTKKVIGTDKKVFKDFLGALQFVSDLVEKDKAGKLSYAIGTIDMSE